MEKIKDRIVTNLQINKCIICKNCPLKLEAKEENKVEYGKGSLLPNVIFVIEPYCVQEEYLKIICEDIINLDEEYITYNPKCITNNQDLKHHTKQCNKYLIYEIFKLKPKKVIFFGIDIPYEIFTNDKGIEVYKLNNLFSVSYGSKTIEQFRKSLRQIL